MCAALPPKLLALDLGSNGCGDQGAKAVGEALKRCANMKRIGLAANELGEVGARTLAPFIRDHASLEELHVTGNRVGDRGCSALAMAVRSTNAPIVKFALNENFNITAGAANLAQCIASSRTLQELDLSKIMIGADGAKALAAGLESPALRVLELGSCKLRADGHLQSARRRRREPVPRATWSVEELAGGQRRVRTCRGWTARIEEPSKFGPSPQLHRSRGCKTTSGDA